MSLVHEALQKAEREKNRKSGNTPLVSPPASTTIGPAVAAVDNRGPRSPSAATVQLAGSPALPQKSHQTVLTALIACVAGVAIVAIVYLVSRATATIRQSKEVLETSTAIAGQPASASAPEPKSRESVPPAATRPAVATQTTATPEAAPASDNAAFKVTGIMKDPEGKWCAVLNGRVAYEGQYVDGATVKRIERDRVTLDIAGREAVVRLF